MSPQPDPADSSPNCSHSRHRRAVLAGLGSLTAGALAGCLGGGDAATPTPVDLGGDKQDDRGGMVIGLHGGPNGQIFYADNAPDHGNPAWFHTLVFGLFPYRFAKRDRGWTATAIYATDYSSVDWSLDERGAGDPVLSSHTGADTVAPARSLTYVAGSAVRGGMGPALVPFSTDADAREFVAEHGGERLAFEDVTPRWLRQYRNEG